MSLISAFSGMYNRTVASNAEFGMSRLADGIMRNAVGFTGNIAQAHQRENNMMSRMHTLSLMHKIANAREKSAKEKEDGLKLNYLA